jgi:predicted amidohydrolase
MRSFVIDPLEEILSEATDDDPITVAEVDLDHQYFQNWLGNMKHRTWKERRPDIPVE